MPKGNLSYKSMSACVASAKKAGVSTKVKRGPNKGKELNKSALKSKLSKLNYVELY